MNKTIIININGIIFHIEEEAYAVLQNYMVGVKRHFGNTVDSNEIVNDIENRIAEMFSERLSPQKAVIQMADVREVCAQMGQVEDFEVGDESTESFDNESFQGYDEGRSFFRDPDDKVLGGVCSGLGHYFDIEAKWIRLIFLVLFLFAGSGFLVYLVLWIVVPKATTRAEKMKMRGQPANIENFKRSFHEEMGDVKRNFSAAGERVRTGLDNPDSGINSFMNTFGKIVSAFVKVIGVFILFALSMGLVSLVLFLFWGTGFWGEMVFDQDFPLHAVAAQYRSPLSIAAFFVMAIPVLFIILLIVRVLFNRKTMNAYLGFSLLLVWFVAIGFSVFYTAQTAIDFKERATITEEINLAPSEVYKLNLRENNTVAIKKGDRSDSTRSQVDIQRTIKRNGMVIYHYNNRISLRIEKGELNQAPMLLEELSAKGMNFDTALERAGRINYEFTQEGENLWLARNPVLPTGEINRDQEVRLTLYIPVGTQIIIPKEIDRNFNLRGFSYDDCEDDHQQANSTNWIMTDTGLKCRDTQIPSPLPIDTLQIDSMQIINP